MRREQRDAVLTDRGFPTPGIRGSHGRLLRARDAAECAKGGPPRGLAVHAARLHVPRRQLQMRRDLLFELGITGGLSTCLSAGVSGAPVLVTRSPVVVIRALTFLSRQCL